MDEEYIKRLSERLPLKPIPWALVLAEEIANQLKEQIKFPRPVTTRPIRYRNLHIEGEFEFFKHEGSGEIRELVIVSPSPNFELVVFIDGLPVVNGKYSELEEESQDYSFLTAIQRNSDYHVSVSGLNFEISARAIIHVFEPITFKKVNVLCDIRG